jgi:hypothetical protein
MCTLVLLRRPAAADRGATALEPAANGCSEVDLFDCAL